MLIVSQETQTKASPTNCCLMSKGARGCAETLISSAYSTGIVFALFANVLKCTSSISSGFVIGPIVKKYQLMVTLLRLLII